MAELHNGCVQKHNPGSDHGQIAAATA
ncbi:unnamed protein product, partial [Didymodactylos carnosus]